MKYCWKIIIVQNSYFLLPVFIYSLKKSASKSPFRCAASQWKVWWLALMQNHVSVCIHCKLSKFTVHLFVVNCVWARNFHQRTIHHCWIYVVSHIVVEKVIIMLKCNKLILKSQSDRVIWVLNFVVTVILFKTQQPSTGAINLGSI